MNFQNVNKNVNIDYRVDIFAKELVVNVYKVLYILNVCKNVTKVLSVDTYASIIYIYNSIK